MYQDIIYSFFNLLHQLSYIQSNERFFSDKRESNSGSSVEKSKSPSTNLTQAPLAFSPYTWIGQIFFIKQLVIPIMKY